ncbi:hypothetical protein MPNT_10025 [Candidatus Methylacidithermus pantelleriae]|uniref:Uncharacterized protein n=2 Tax=Candidatus Methylacidithermus pantelleriae TaxID=2744239 RepID=A0A8J2BPT0_9BACT|nr:hypothetical protein MPNT_10025 [Candidatus Methylacidithermus pantelleriae]
MGWFGRIVWLLLVLLPSLFLGSGLFDLLAEQLPELSRSILFEGIPETSEKTTPLENLSKGKLALAWQASDGTDRDVLERIELMKASEARSPETPLPLFPHPTVVQGSGQEFSWRESEVVSQSRTELPAGLSLDSFQGISSFENSPFGSGWGEQDVRWFKREKDLLEWRAAQYTKGSFSLSQEESTVHSGLGSAFESSQKQGLAFQLDQRLGELPVNLWGQTGTLRSTDRGLLGGDQWMQSGWQSGLQWERGKERKEGLTLGLRETETSLLPGTRESAKGAFGEWRQGLSSRSRFKVRADYNRASQESLLDRNVKDRFLFSAGPEIQLKDSLSAGVEASYRVGEPTLADQLSGRGDPGVMFKLQGKF